MKNVPTLIVYIFFSAYCARGAKILCVFNLASVSHQVVFQPIWRELSLRGHEVTVITPNPLKDPKLTNLTEIDLSYMYNRQSEGASQISLGQNHWFLTGMILDVAPQMAESFFTEPPVQALINDASAKFDVVLAEYAIPFPEVFAARFKCPFIAVSSLGVRVPTYDALGNPYHPLLTPDHTVNIESKTLLERIELVVFAIWQRYYYHYATVPKLDAVIKKHFGQDMPYFGEIEKNVDLVFHSINPVFHGARANLPSFIQIGRMHIKPKKPLPQVYSAFAVFRPQYCVRVLYDKVMSQVVVLYASLASYIFMCRCVMRI